MSTTLLCHRPTASITCVAREWIAAWRKRPALDLDRAIDRLHPLAAALLIMSFAALGWLSVFFAGASLGLLLREVLP